MDSSGAYERIQLFLADLNQVLGYWPPSTPGTYGNFKCNSFGRDQNSWRRPTHRSRLWKQNRRGNGQERPWHARHPPPHTSLTKRSKISRNFNSCVVRLPPRQLPNNDVHHQHERCYLGGMGPSTIQMRSNTQQLGDFQSISKHDVDLIGQPQGDCLGFDLDALVEFALESEDVSRMLINAPYDGQPGESPELGHDHYYDMAINEKNADIGSVPSPADDAQDPSERGELQLDNGSDCDSRVDLGIDVDPAQYDESCSHSSSASIASPDLELVPSTDDCHEPTHSPDPLQTEDTPDYSDCSDQHVEHACGNSDHNDTPDIHHHSEPDNYKSDHASNFEGRHSDHDPGEDQYADGGHYDAGDVYDDHGADADPVDDYHDDDYYDDNYYDDGGDHDYYDDDY
ncbi:hypothetical protein MJO28_009576 [Puccinia striiformis f. sp. tritici]|uniref:Uncharacterized protein n=1 Tax=Puccinia striiformis f. sp. tritici TaxID=168172 RepID=A0ACC0E8A6_9BASI|nr:hypothetical protein MJO28_009576 [Puccinia striiformis f. sp. tritici]